MNTSENITAEELRARLIHHYSHPTETSFFEVEQYAKKLTDKMYPTWQTPRGSISDIPVVAIRSTVSRIVSILS